MLNFLIELHRNSRVEKFKPSSLSFGRQICTMVSAFLAEMLETGDDNREPPLIGLPLSLTLFSRAQISGGVVQRPKFLPHYMELLT